MLFGYFKITLYIKSVLKIGDRMKTAFFIILILIQASLSAQTSKIEDDAVRGVIDLLKEQGSPVKQQISLEETGNLIRKLSHDSFDVREQATVELINKAYIQKAMLQKAYESKDPEIRIRMKRIFDAWAEKENGLLARLVNLDSRQRDILKAHFKRLIDDGKLEEFYFLYRPFYAESMMKDERLNERRISIGGIFMDNLKFKVELSHVPALEEREYDPENCIKISDLILEDPDSKVSDYFRA
jgi:hypothetical protein